MDHLLWLFQQQSLFAGIKLFWRNWKYKRIIVPDYLARRLRRLRYQWKRRDLHFVFALSLTHCCLLSFSIYLLTNTFLFCTIYEKTIQKSTIQNMSIFHITIKLLLLTSAVSRSTRQYLSLSLRPSSLQAHTSLQFPPCFPVIPTNSTPPPQYLPSLLSSFAAMMLFLECLVSSRMLSLLVIWTLLSQVLYQLIS